MHEDSGLYAIRKAELFDRFLELARYQDQGMRLFDREGEMLFETNDGNRPEIDRGQLRDMLLTSIPAGVAPLESRVDGGSRGGRRWLQPSLPRWTEEACRLCRGR